jgi:MtfA peptidase
MLIFITLVAGALGAWMLLRRRRTVRRAALLAAPCPGEWLDILDRNVALYRKLPRDLQHGLHGRMNVFLHEKTFEGCGGLTVNDEIRVTIAAQACMLLLNRTTDYFPGFTTILVYPDTFVVPTTHRDGLLETRDVQARLGESWHRGPVVLSWADIVRDASEHRDGCNVVLHEFAHKLDEENDVMDGLPVLAADSHYASWTDVLRQEYVLLQEDAAHGEPSVLDEYGATSPPEFFAVATEAFFETPAELADERPQLYRELKNFYKVDPRRWEEK